MRLVGVFAKVANHAALAVGFACLADVTAMQDQPGQLPALPIYFQNQDRIVGLMFLLTLALRAFTLIEFVVRQAISASKQKLAGLYDGNPQRATERPSAEQLLKAFDHLTLYLLPDTSIFVTKLSALHRQILSLLKLPDSIYSLHLRPHQT